MDTIARRHLDEARSRRNLGYYDESSRHYDRALAEDPENVLLILEAASLKRAQGLARDCHASLTAWDSRMDRANTDPLHVAVFDIFLAGTVAAVTVRCREPLDRASEAYTKLCLDRPVDYFDKITVWPCPNPASTSGPASDTRARSLLPAAIIPSYPGRGLWATGIPRPSPLGRPTSSLRWCDTYCLSSRVPMPSR